METYFIPTEDILRKNADNFESFSGRLAKHCGAMVNRKPWRCEELAEYSCATLEDLMEQSPCVPQVILQFDFATGVVTVRFAVWPDNQKVLWMVRSVNRSEYRCSEVVCRFDCFTQETEQGLATLMKEYFTHGAGGLVGVFLSDIQVVA